MMIHFQVGMNYLRTITRLRFKDTRLVISAVEAAGEHAWRSFWVIPGAARVCL